MFSVAYGAWSDNGLVVKNTKIRLGKFLLLCMSWIEIIGPIHLLILLDFA